MMHKRTGWFTCVLLCLMALPVEAQLPPVQTNPLGSGQAIQGAAGCSATDVSSCTQAATKIMPIVMGDSPTEENPRRLTDGVGGRMSGSPQMDEAVEWGMAAFRAAGVDVHTEKYMMPHGWSEGETRLEVLAPARFPVSLGSGGLPAAKPPR